MERRDFRSADLAQPRPAQGGQDVSLQHGAVRGNAGGLQVSLHVGAHEAFGESRYGGLRLGRFGHRLLAALDAVDNEGGLFPGLIDGQLPVTAERQALGTPGSPGLHHPGLPAGGVDAHPEARLPNL